MLTFIGDENDFDQKIEKSDKRERRENERNSMRVPFSVVKGEKEQITRNLVSYRLSLTSTSIDLSFNYAPG